MKTKQILEACKDCLCNSCLNKICRESVCFVCETKYPIGDCKGFITDLPDKCTDCDSEFVDKAQGSCGYCYLHGYKELGNGGEEVKEYNEDPNDYDDEDEEINEYEKRKDDLIDKDTCDDNDDINR